MGRQPKSTPAPIIGDLFVAQADGSIAKDKDPQPASNPFNKKPRLKWLRLINAFCYALSALIVLSSIHTSTNDDYQNAEAWMTNQTLLSVAPYTQYIWYALYFLQGLFITASFLPSLWSSELLGYTALTDKTTAKEALFKKSLPVAHYSPLCASTALSVYSFFIWNLMSLAFASSCASTFFLVRIIKYHLDTVTAFGATFNKMKRWFQRRPAPDAPPDENTLNEYLNNDGVDVTNQIQHYIFLKLPFELYAGYNLAWSVSLYNIIVCKLFGSVVLSELLAFVSLVALVGVGCYVMWTEKKGLCYGVGVGMAWYLVSRSIVIVDCGSTRICMGASFFSQLVCLSHTQTTMHIIYGIVGRNILSTRLPILSNHVFLFGCSDCSNKIHVNHLCQHSRLNDCTAGSEECSECK